MYMNVRELITAFLIGVSLYLLVNRVFMVEGIDFEIKDKYTCQRACDALKQNLTCEWVEDCTNFDGGLGCNVGGINPNCRACGSGGWAPCRSPGPSPSNPPSTPSPSSPPPPPPPPSPWTPSFCNNNFSKMDISALDLDAEKHGFIEYYLEVQPIQDVWHIAFDYNSGPPVHDTYILSLLDCLSRKFNIKSIRVRKEDCTRLFSKDGFLTDYKYKLTVNGADNTKGATAGFQWVGGEYDTLHWGSNWPADMCYNSDGPLKFITTV